MELRHIEAFIAVAEELSFRRAAERLHIAQPPLSQQIKRLERDVGAVLLRRTTRHVALTPAGEAFLHRARRAVQGVHAARRAAQEVVDGKTGGVRLGFGGAASPEVLMLLTKMYRTHRPDVRLDVAGPLHGTELVEQLDRDEIDAGLLRLPVRGSRIAFREIARHAMAVALPAEHPLADRPRVDLAELRDEPVIGYRSDLGGTVPTLIQGAFLRRGISPHIVQLVSDVHTLLALVGAGAGIGFAPMSAGHIRLPGVALVPVPDIPPLPLALAWRADDTNPALLSLVDLLDDVQAGLADASLVS
ncbi:LysR substrate-binding domain-containing protein [Streptomyces sp. Ru62]|uniref:LysR substrate-binding domain-containing protein n=1 Tax=Streptomyces sp. Ru62 TaxID=2080745 RepID=UPI0015E2768F|nr:LysR substrate-binding domain-containing protein [Streptomyces sp. Ru62]